MLLSYNKTILLKINNHLNINTMKKILFVLPLIALSLVSCEKDNGKEDELSGDDIIQFEDPNFLKALLTVQKIEINYVELYNRDYIIDVDKNRDGQISVKEAQQVRGLTLWDYDAEESFNVSEIPEIKYFTTLESLDCCSNQLTLLDVSNNTDLRELYCSDNQLITLDVSNNTDLMALDCWGNQLTSLDVSNNTALDILYCENNQLTSLDVSNNPALVDLFCNNNQLTTLDVCSCIALEELDFDGNPLKTLIISASQQNAEWLNGVKAEYPGIEIIVK